MESLERSLNNITIDDGPWRQHDQSQPVWGNGGVQPGRVWGHVPVQFQGRSPWQDSNEIEQGINEALGLTSSNSTQWGGPMQNQPSEYDKQIWSDPLNEPHFPPPHGNFSGGAMNGIGGPEWSAGGMQTGSQPPQPIWSDGGMGKESDVFWKSQQQQPPQGQWGAPPMPGGWPPRQMNHPNGPPPQQPPRDYGGGWQPNGMRQQKQMNMPWGDQQRMPIGMGSKVGGRPPTAQSRFPGGMQGVDVSVPPPMDMQHMGMGMRQMPPPGHAPWKGPGNNVAQGAHNGGHRQYPPRGGMNHGGQSSAGSMWNGGTNSSMSGAISEQFNYPPFPIGGPADDLTLTVWHDPNGDLKKWQRDTGVSNWGDPDKQQERPIRNWLVPEGEEEDLETALSRCPVPQKKVGKPEENSRAPFPIPSKRPIVVTGWGELPENDPNNPTKNDSLGIFDDSARWADLTVTENPWYVPTTHQNAPFTNENTGSWVQGGTIPLNEPTAGTNPQLQLAEMLKYAVDKGYLDISVTMSQNLPPMILQNVNGLLSKIPALESVENELKSLVDSVRPPGEDESQNPQRFMNEVQKVEHNRLIIDVTTAKIEVQELSKKIQRALIEAGIVQPQQERQATSEDYHYSFLDSSAGL